VLDLPEHHDFSSMLDQVATEFSAGPVHGSHVIDGWSGVDDVLAAKSHAPAIVSERISEPASEAVTGVVELAGAASGDAEAALDAVASELAAAAGPPLPEEIVDLPVTESADAALEVALAALEAMPVSETGSVESRSVDTPHDEASGIVAPRVEVSSPAIDVTRNIETPKVETARQEMPRLETPASTPVPVLVAARPILDSKGRHRTTPKKTRAASGPAQVVALERLLRKVETRRAQLQSESVA